MLHLQVSGGCATTTTSGSLVQLSVGSWAAVECVTYGNCAAGIGYALSCGPTPYDWLLPHDIVTQGLYQGVASQPPLAACHWALLDVQAAQRSMLLSQTLSVACASDASRGPWWESLLASYRSAGCAAALTHHDHQL
jgi:hypothetical protein